MISFWDTRQIDSHWYSMVLFDVSPCDIIIKGYYHFIITIDYNPMSFNFPGIQPAGHTVGIELIVGYPLIP